MRECLEETYLQATKEKKFQLKQLQSVRLGTKNIDKFIKEFKGICEKSGPKIMLGRGRGNNNINSRETCFKPAGQGTGSQNSQYGPGSLNNKSFQSENKERNIIESCQICGRNNHTALKCFYWWNYSYQSADELSQATTRHHIHTEALTKQVFCWVFKVFFARYSNQARSNCSSTH